MKKTYKEVKHTFGKDGIAGWGEPTKVLRECVLDDKTAAEINSQFNNTGIKMVEVATEATEPAKKPKKAE